MAKKGIKQQKYTPEFKIEIAKSYLNCEGSLKSIMKKYGLRSDYQVYKWVKLYKEEGPEAFLIETRGRNSKGRPKSIELEKMSLEEQVEYLKMEVEILKKAQALLKD